MRPWHEGLELARPQKWYPGPVGEVLSRELLTSEEFGYRLGGGQLILQLVDHVLKTPLAQSDAA